jgi:hypothetical protein
MDLESNGMKGAEVGPLIGENTSVNPQICNFGVSQLRLRWWVSF